MLESVALCQTSGVTASSTAYQRVTLPGNFPRVSPSCRTLGPLFEGLVYVTGSVGGRSGRRRSQGPMRRPVVAGRCFPGTRCANRRPPLRSSFLCVGVSPPDARRLPAGASRWSPTLMSSDGSVPTGLRQSRRATPLLPKAFGADIFLAWYGLAAGRLGASRGVWPTKRTWRAWTHLWSSVGPMVTRKRPVSCIFW